MIYINLKKFITKIIQKLLKTERYNLCQCPKCGNYFQEKPRIPCSCGETKRIYSLTVEETVGCKDSGTLSISQFLSVRNINNTSFNNKITKSNFQHFLENKEILECSSEGIIYLHDEFIKGTQNADLGQGKLIDFQNIKGDNLEIFNNFIDCCINNDLYGKNKPSHGNNSSHMLYPDYWHYHCGPYTNPINNNKIDNLSQKNLNGNTSGPVIHYIKNEQQIMIVAFAIEHTNRFVDKSKIQENIDF